MKKPKIYLAGPINGCTDEECKDWRNKVKEELKDYCTFVDPMDRDFRGKKKHSPDDIVEWDLKKLKECDVLLANNFKPAAGTSCEVVYAYQYKLYVINVGSDSPWIQYHSDVNLSTVDRAIEFIKFISEEVKEYVENGDSSKN